MAKTLAEELAHENELLRRRFVHHTRPMRPLTMDEARKLHEAVIDSSKHAYDPEPETIVPSSLTPEKNMSLQEIRAQEVAALQTELRRWKGMYLRDTTKLTELLTGIEVALARDEDLNGAMRLIVEYRANQQSQETEKP
jgi:hypothetical protein